MQNHQQPDQSFPVESISLHQQACHFYAVPTSLIHDSIDGNAGDVGKALTSAAASVPGLGNSSLGGIPEEVKDTGYYIVDSLGKAVGYADKLMNVPSYITIPVRFFLEWSIFQQQKLFVERAAKCKIKE